MPEGYRTSNSGEFKYGENQGGTVVTAARAKSLQGMDELQYQRSKKWERSPDNVLDIEKTAAIHSFSSDEEVTGLITMEDVIEELLQVGPIYFTLQSQSLVAVDCGRIVDDSSHCAHNFWRHNISMTLKTVIAGTAP